MTDRRRRGFTMIEVLIVIGILAVLLAIAAPMLGGYIQRLRFNEGARTFSEAVLRARDTATRNSIAVRLEAAADTVSWFDQVSGAALGSVSLPNGVAVTDSVTVFMSGRGLPLNQAEFQLADSNHSGSVWLLPTGAILR